MARYHVNLTEETNKFYTSMAKCLNISTQEVLETTLRKTADLMSSIVDLMVDGKEGNV